MSAEAASVEAAGYQVSDELALWWLADPSQPRLVGTLRHVRRQAALQHGGVSLSYHAQWLASGMALSEDLPLKPDEQLFRRMAFNVLIDNTADHEKNHALILDAAQLYQLSPAYDVLPTGQALGYQQMRVGREGAESSWRNLVSEPRAFAMDAARAKAVGSEVAEVVQTWRDHFKATGVIDTELDLLSQQIDRPFLLEQRKQALG